MPAGSAAGQADGVLTPEEVHHVAFSRPFGRRGYNIDEVDAFLDRVEAALRNPADSARLVGQLDNVVFSPPPWARRGYDDIEVDAFVDHVRARFRMPVVQSVRPRRRSPMGDSLRAVVRAAAFLLDN